MKTAPKVAVILAAGKGSRRLPVTRAVDKAMLPIANRPVVDYVVEQAACAGVERIIFVISDPGSLIKKYYETAIDTKREYPWLDLDTMIHCEYVIQPADDMYGTAVALACVRNEIADEDSFIVVPADGFIYTETASVLKDVVSAYVQDNDASAALAGLKTNADEASLYSTIDYSQDTNALKGLNEKPTNLDPTKTYLSNVSYYVLPPTIFDYISGLAPVRGEYLLTDAVTEFAQAQKVAVLPVEGRYLDSGQLKVWVESNVFMLKRLENPIDIS
jgi:UTP--glucose-1-phosphate uridylyltransferase